MSTAHTGRLETLEGHATRTNVRLDQIEATQATHGGKLDQIVFAVTTQGARPVFDVAATIASVRDVFAICGILGSLAIWFVVTMATADSAVTALKIDHLRERQQWLEQRFSWQPTIEARAR